MSVLQVETEGPVPRTVHMVWVGSEPPPQVAERWEAWASACEQAGADLVLWTDDEVDDLLPMTAALRPRVADIHPVLLADIARIEAVHRYGGVYLDSDTRPLRALDPILDRERGWGSLNLSKSRRGIEMNNAAFGFSAGHPFLALLWSRIMPRLEKRYARITHYAGPPVWTKAWLDNPFAVDGMEPGLIYPVPWWEAGKLSGWTAERVAEEYPQAVVWHEFAQSWNGGR